MSKTGQERKEDFGDDETADRMLAPTKAGMESPEIGTGHWDRNIFVKTDRLPARTRYPLEDRPPASQADTEHHLEEATHQVIQEDEDDESFELSHHAAEASAVPHADFLGNAVERVPKECDPFFDTPQFAESEEPDKIGFEANEQALYPTGGFDEEDRGRESETMLASTSAEQLAQGKTPSYHEVSIPVEHGQSVAAATTASEDRPVASIEREDGEYNAVQETAPGGAESSGFDDTSTHDFLDDFPKEDFFAPTNDPEALAAYEEANELSVPFLGPDDDFWKTGVPTVAGMPAGDPETTTGADAVAGGQLGSSDR